MRIYPLTYFFGSMPQRKYPRIEIDQRAYDALQAEGILQHRTVREIATEAILSHISTEAISFVDRKTVMREDIATKRPLDHKTILDECGAVTDSDKPKRKRLAKDQAAIGRIKEMWMQSPRPTKAEIARAIGYPATTTGEMITRMLKRGELVD